MAKKGNVSVTETGKAKKCVKCGKIDTSVVMGQHIGDGGKVSWTNRCKSICWA